MTYGWALIIILLVAVVAWRWGLFNTNQTIQPGQYGFWGVTPSDFKMDSSGTLTIVLTNGAGANVTVKNITVISGTVNVSVNNGGSGWIMEPGDYSPKIVVNGLRQGADGSRFDLFIIMNYTNSKMLANRERLSSGSIWGSYE
jgi:hypothetical protein